MGIKSGGETAKSLPSARLRSDATVGEYRLTPRVITGLDKLSSPILFPSGTRNNKIERPECIEGHILRLRSGYSICYPRSARSKSAQNPAYWLLPKALY